MNELINEWLTNLLSEGRNEWINERMTERMNEWVHKWVNEWTNKLMYDQVNAVMKEQAVVISQYFLFKRMGLPALFLRKRN